MSGFIETYMGHKVDPKNMNKDDVYLLDIAHSLSQTCRFVGHCRNFYSVAQHCINVSDILKHRGFDERIQLLGLLHDASEAYVGDLSTTVKSELPDYKEIETNVESAILNHFLQSSMTNEEKKEIKTVDNIVFYNEALALLPNRGNWILEHDFPIYPINTRFLNMQLVEEDYKERVERLVKQLKRK